MRLASAGPGMSARRIRRVLSDVDGTLVTPDKVLADRSIEAVQRS